MKKINAYYHLIYNSLWWFIIQLIYCRHISSSITEYITQQYLLGVTCECIKFFFSLMFSTASISIFGFYFHFSSSCFCEAFFVFVAMSLTWGFSCSSSVVTSDPSFSSLWSFICCITRSVTNYSEFLFTVLKISLFLMAVAQILKYLQGVPHMF